MSEVLEAALALRPALMRQALKLTNHKEDAEDIVQDAYLRVLKFLPDLEVSKVRGAMFRRLYQSHIDALRKRSQTGYDTHKENSDNQTQVLHYMVEGFTETVGYAHNWSDLSTRLDAFNALSHLPQKYQDITLAVVLDGWKAKEWCREQGYPTGTAQLWVKRGYEALRESYEKVA